MMHGYNGKITALCVCLIHELAPEKFLLHPDMFKKNTRQPKITITSRGTNTKNKYLENKAYTDDVLVFFHKKS